MSRSHWPATVTTLLLWGHAPAPAQPPADLSRQEYLLSLTTEPNGRGCEVKSVGPNSPCRMMTGRNGKVGEMEPGDTIVSVNGFRTTDQPTLLKAINASSDGAMLLGVVDKNTGRVERWKVAAAGNPGYTGDPAVKRCQTRINRLLTEKGLHPSIVPNQPFDLATFNHAVFDMMWQAAADEMAAVIQAECRLRNKPVLSYAIVKDPATNKHLVVFNDRVGAETQRVLERAFALQPANFAKWQVRAVTETFVTDQFKAQFRPNGRLRLDLVKDGIRTQFDGAASIVARSRVTVSYTADDTSAYAISPWTSVAVGDADRGVSDYYWRLHSGVIRVPGKDDLWSLGSVVVIGQLPKGENDPNLRITNLRVSDQHSDLARLLRVTVSDRNAGTMTPVVRTVKLAEPGEPREFVDELTAGGNQVSLLDYGKGVLDELKTALIGR